ncbi:hypothetical protein [Nonomuraea sp. NPDC050643]|uniref:hypothetical protein n=1 Tax=Nonomuraea sp. NPDC050643 TaxID=3155660 RepID=UPI0033C7B9E0
MPAWLSSPVSAACWSHPIAANSSSMVTWRFEDDVVDGVTEIAEHHLEPGL